MGYKLNIYDPKVKDERILDDLNSLNKLSNSSSNTLKSDKLQIHNSLNESIKETDVILILTEWDEFKNFESDAKIIDTRNIYNGNKYFKL
jgi:UDP-glucose 6-dehydrogenase